MPSTPKRTTRSKLPERLSLEDLNHIALKSGGHSKRALDALCVMEAVAWFAGREHTDKPPCVSPTIAGFLRSWNDALNDADRQMLKPLIPRVINTVGTPEQELQRSYMALDWYCRVSAPSWLRLAGLTAEAETIEATAPIVDSASAAAAQDALDKARHAAHNARDAAWDAAGVAAGVAAWVAAWDAARVAAGDAAWVAARVAARVAAGDAAGVAAWDAAWDAAGVAAGDAAWEKLRPTVELLQQSALDLIGRMIAVTATEPPTEAPR